MFSDVARGAKQSELLGAPRYTPQTYALRGGRAGNNARPPRPTSTLSSLWSLTVMFSCVSGSSSIRRFVSMRL